MATCLLALPSVSESVKWVGWLTSTLLPLQGFFKQVLNIPPPGSVQNGRASDCVHLRQALRRAVSAGTLLWLTHLSGGSVWEAGRWSLCGAKLKAPSSPAPLVPSPRETPAVHCASPFFLFQGPRGPDGPAGEQGSKGLKVLTPVANPSFHLLTQGAGSGIQARSLLCNRPLGDSRVSPRGCRTCS